MKRKRERKWKPEDLEHAYRRALKRYARRQAEHQALMVRARALQRQLAS